jgi:hypothetical protein
MSTDSEQWVELRKRLSEAPVGALSGPVHVYSHRHKNSPGSVKALDVARISRFFVDVSDGDRKKATCLARRFSRESGDRIFARAVSVAVERYLARIEVK